MPDTPQYLSPAILRDHAESVLKEAGVSRAQVARNLNVSPPAITNAFRDDDPKRYVGTLKRIVELYSEETIEGPFFRVVPKESLEEPDAA